MLSVTCNYYYYFIFVLFNVFLRERTVYVQYSKHQELKTQPVLGDKYTITKRF